MLTSQRKERPQPGVAQVKPTHHPRRDATKTKPSALPPFVKSAAPCFPKPSPATAVWDITPAENLLPPRRSGAVSCSSSETASSGRRPLPSPGLVGGRLPMRIIHPRSRRAFTLIELLV